MASWKDAGIGRRRYGSRRIMFGKAAVALYSKSEEVSPDRLAHIAATLSQGQGGIHHAGQRQFHMDTI